MSDSAKIRIKVGEYAVEAPPGAVLMEALVSGGLLLRSDCGGRGRCGKCLVRVVHGEPGALSDALEAERHRLGPERLAAGYRLACCAQVFAEVAAEIPPESRLAAEGRLRGDYRAWDYAIADPAFVVLVRQVLAALRRRN